MLNFETCLKLEELGFPQEGILLYGYFNSYDEVLITELHTKQDVEWGLYQDNEFENTVSCPTFEEIWNELPMSIEHSNGNNMYLHLDRTSLTVSVLYYTLHDLDIENTEDEQEFIYKSGTDLVSIAAEMWIELKQRNII